MLHTQQKPTAKPLTQTAGKYLYLISDAVIGAHSFRSCMDLHRLAEGIQHGVIANASEEEFEKITTRARWQIERGNVPERVLDALQVFAENAFHLAPHDARSFVQLHAYSPFLRFNRKLVELAEDNKPTATSLKILHQCIEDIKEAHLRFKRLSLPKILIKKNHAPHYWRRHAYKAKMSLGTDKNDLLLFGAALRGISLTLTEGGLTSIDIAMIERVVSVMEALTESKDKKTLPFVFSEMAMHHDPNVSFEEQLKLLKAGELSPFDIGLNHKQQPLRHLIRLGEVYLNLPDNVQRLAKDIKIPSWPRHKTLKAIEVLGKSLREQCVTANITDFLRSLPEHLRIAAITLLTNHPKSAELIKSMVTSGLESENVFFSLQTFTSKKFPSSKNDTIIEDLLEIKHQKIDQEGWKQLTLFASAVDTLHPELSGTIQGILQRRPDLLSLLQNITKDEDLLYRPYLAYLLLQNCDNVSLQASQQKLDVCSEKRCSEILQMENPFTYFTQTPLSKITQDAKPTDHLEITHKSTPLPVTPLVQVPFTTSSKSISWKEKMLQELKTDGKLNCESAKVEEAFQSLPPSLHTKVQFIYLNYPDALDSFVSDSIKYGGNPTFQLFVRNPVLFSLYIDDVMAHQHRLPEHLDPNDSPSHGIRAKLFALIATKPKNPAASLSLLITSDQSEQESLEQELLADATDQNVETLTSFPYKRVIIVGGYEGRKYWKINTDNYPFKVQFMSAFTQGRIPLTLSETDYVLMLTNDAQHTTYYAIKDLANNAGSGFHHYSGGYSAIKRHLDACQAAFNKQNIQGN